MAAAVRLLGFNEAALRLVPVLSALGCAMCLLAIAIDVGVGRHAGAVAGLVLLAMPLTYELSHRALPELLIALASTGAVALTSHSLHGHKFDRHILPFQKEAEEPQPLALRRLPMLFASLGIGAAAFVDPRAGAVALLFALLDMLFAHRYLFRKRRVWAMLAGGLGLTVIAVLVHPVGPRTYLGWQGTDAMVRDALSLWHQGTTLYGRHIGPVVIVATGFGLLLGSMRRASRSLLAWVLVASATALFTQQSSPPRGLGLLLPPLALAAAVGLQSPTRVAGGAWRLGDGGGARRGGPGDGGRRYRAAQERHAEDPGAVAAARAAERAAVCAGHADRAAIAVRRPQDRRARFHRRAQGVALAGAALQLSRAAGHGAGVSAGLRAASPDGTARSRRRRCCPVRSPSRAPSAQAALAALSARPVRARHDARHRGAAAGYRRTSGVADLTLSRLPFGKIMPQANLETLTGRSIVVGVAGGIAAYKAAELVRLLRKAGAEVRVVMTEAAQQFITPLTLQALSQHPVATDTFDLTQEATIGHIELADRAELLVVAPATADVIARLAHGLANDLLDDGGAGLPRAAAARAGDERQHVAAPGDAGTTWRTLRRRAARTPSGRTRASWRAAGSAQGRMSSRRRSPTRGAALLGAARPARAARAGDRGADLRADRSGALRRQSLDGQDGLRDGARGGAARRARSRWSPGRRRCRRRRASSASTWRARPQMRDGGAASRRADAADVIVMSAAVADYRPAEAAPQKLKKAAAAAKPQLALSRRPTSWPSSAARAGGGRCSSASPPRPTTSRSTRAQAAREGLRPHRRQRRQRGGLGLRHRHQPRHAVHRRPQDAHRETAAIT